MIHSMCQQVLGVVSGKVEDFPSYDDMTRRAEGPEPIKLTLLDANGNTWMSQVTRQACRRLRGDRQEWWGEVAIENLGVTRAICVRADENGENATYS